MRPISAFAQGFLDLLGVRDGGQGVRELENAARAVVDLTPMLAAQRQQMLNANFGALVGGWNLAYTVPTNTVLWLQGGEAQLTTPAGASASFCLMATPPQNPGGARLVLSDLATIAASQVRFAVLKYPGLWFPAGTQFGLYATDLVGAPTAQVNLYGALFQG